MPSPSYSLERSLGGVVAGVDEAGRGPWAGPVVAACVVIPYPRKLPTGINDSKKVTAAERQRLHEEILRTCHAAIGIATVGEIDRHNILAATMLAMRRAVDCLDIRPHFVLVDGNRVPELECPARAVIGGDAVCLSIAAASIVAKVTRDRLMRAIALEYPGYGWERNAGYGTAEHQRAIERLGVTLHHRRSFAPVKLALKNVNLHGAAA